jgi:hypothetical protein
MLINIEFFFLFLPIPIISTQHEKFEGLTPSTTAIDHHHNKPNKKLQRL